MKHYKKKNRPKEWYLYMARTNNSSGTYELPIDRDSFKSFYDRFNESFPKARIKRIRVDEEGHRWLVLSIREKTTADAIKKWLRTEEGILFPISPYPKRELGDRIRRRGNHERD